MIRSSVALLVSLLFFLIIFPAHSKLERKSYSPLKTGLKALRTVSEIKSMQKRFKSKLENKVQNAVGDVLSDDMAKSLSGAAVMLITKEVKVRYKDFRLTLDSDELILTYGKGF